MPLASALVVFLLASKNPPPPPDAPFDLTGLGAALLEWRQRCPIK